MNQSKYHFLKNDLVPLLQKLQPDSKGLWGTMGSQQMIEHMTDAVKMANGKLQLPKVNEGERLEKFRQFMNSEIPFGKNIKNPFLGETGLPLRKPDLAAAIAKLQSELDDFFLAFEKNPALRTSNPFFGELDYAENIQLLHKHAEHHARQFGLLP